MPLGSETRRTITICWRRANSASPSVGAAAYCKKPPTKSCKATGQPRWLRISGRPRENLRLPPEKIGQHRLSLGTAEDGRELTLAIRGFNMLIAGDPRSGKSWVTGLMCEQLILQGYSVCVIDPEGDYRTLETLPGVVVFGGEDPPPELPDLARVLRHPDMSVVIDLSHAPYQEKMNYMKSLLPMLAAIRRTYRPAAPDRDRRSALLFA